MFKNIILYRIGEGWPQSATQWGEALAREPFVACAATQPKSGGWIPPRGQEHGALAENIGGQWLARYAIETKAVPGQALRRYVEEAVQKIEKERGHKPGRKELRDLREDAVQALLPRAFPRRTEVAVWINPQRRWLALDTGSQTKADEVISSLARMAEPGFSFWLLQTKKAPPALMAEWLLAAEDGDAPEPFFLGRDCELTAIGEEPANVRYTRHTLAPLDARRHMREEEMLPIRLALEWQGRVGFTLTQGLQIKKIHFDEGLFAGEQASAEDRFDADAAIATGELTGLIGDLIEALGGDSAVRPESGGAA